MVLVAGSFSHNFMPASQRVLRSSRATVSVGIALSGILSPFVSANVFAFVCLSALSKKKCVMRSAFSRRVLSSTVSSRIVLLPKNGSMWNQRFFMVPVQVISVPLNARDGKKIAWTRVAPVPSPEASIDAAVPEAVRRSISRTTSRTASLICKASVVLKNASGTPSPFSSQSSDEGGSGSQALPRPLPQSSMLQVSLG